MPERHDAVPATDQTTSPNQAPENAVPDKKPWLDLSFIQVAGGALAAMTAAALGSRFSVEGTIVGAALASVIAAVASALYTASLRRTREAVRGVISGRRTPAAAGGGAPVPEPVPSGSTAVTPAPAGMTGSSARVSRRRAILVSSVIGALATFGIAAGAVTAYESLTGRALSGGDGTTFTQVQEQRDSREDRPTEDDSPAPTESAEPSESAEADPTAEPSVTAEAEPSTAEPSDEPTAEPSTSAEPEPSTTAAPPESEPSQAPTSR